MPFLSFYMQKDHSFNLEQYGPKYGEVCACVFQMCCACLVLHCTDSPCASPRCASLVAEAVSVACRMQPVSSSDTTELLFTDCTSHNSEGFTHNHLTIKYNALFANAWNVAGRLYWSCLEQKFSDAFIHVQWGT